MTGRLPVCEDAAAISERIGELQAERMASIAGCQCPPDGDGGQTHRPGCALEPRPAAMPSQMELARAAMRRARARLRLRSCTCAPSEAPRPCPHKYALGDCWTAANASGPDRLATCGSRLRPSPREASPGEDVAERRRTADDFMAEGIAAKSARHLVLS